MAASASSLMTRRGGHQFSIFCYGDLVKRARPGEYIASATFRCAGYDWAILFYPAGDSILEKDQGRVSMAIRLLMSRGITVEEAKGFFTLHINGDKEEKFDIQVAPGGTNCWWHSMASKDVPVEDDRITINFTVELCREKNGSPDGAADQDLAVVTVPPPNMSQHLLQFLESKEGADVTFHVEHREFPAHKLLLAMRSPVFRAEFFGSMKEAATRSVRILDMKADAFEAVLRFAYSDETPPDVHRVLHLDCGGAEKARLTGRMRDLLAAADRFGLERMRLMCEKALCEAMDEEKRRGGAEAGRPTPLPKAQGFLHPVHLFCSRRARECDGHGSLPGAQGELPFCPRRAPRKACNQGRPSADQSLSRKKKGD